ncbi:MAG TPA: hypothetical protein VMS21_00125 [Methylomirabilota bacterium]|nr:hypothetical protein [Methylomirabilota bacterium]
MTALFYQSLPASFSLVEALREPAAVAAVRRTAPDELAREELLLRKLGPRGWGRVHHFRNYYASDWGENGRVLSPKALDAFFRFVEEAQFPAGGPSVFLTDRGGIELCWEDREGRPVQIEFTGTGAEFYQAATEEEGVVAFDSLAQLARRLSA